MSGRARLRTLFINENIGGHATVHHHLKPLLTDHAEIDATFVDVPTGRLRRLAGAPVPLLSRLDADLQPLRAQLALSAWVRQRLRRLAGTYDALHVYTQNAALLSAGPLQAVPSVVSLDTTNARNAYRLPYRSPGPFTGVTVAASKPFERRVFNAATTIVANSNWAATSLFEDYGVAGSRVEILPFGISGPDGPRPVRRPEDRPRIIFLGRQFESKGGAVLLDAYRSLADRADLTLVTKEPVSARPGVTVVADLEQGDGRLWELLDSSSILAFPSPIDQAPNAVLEAMAAGLPVVAVDTAAVGEMVKDGETGILINRGDVEGLAAALNRLVTDVDLRLTMGAAGRKRFEQLYDARIATERLVQIILAAADRRPRSDMAR